MIGETSKAAFGDALVSFPMTPETYNAQITTDAFPIELHTRLDHTAACLHILTGYPACSVTREKRGYFSHFLGSA